jgi:hypothetical protein
MIAQAGATMAMCAEIKACDVVLDMVSGQGMSLQTVPWEAINGAYIPVGRKGQTKDACKDLTRAVKRLTKGVRKTGGVESLMDYVVVDTDGNQRGYLNEEDVNPSKSSMRKTLKVEDPVVIAVVQAIVDAMVNKPGGVRYVVASVNLIWTEGSGQDQFAHHDAKAVASHIFTKGHGFAFMLPIGGLCHLYVWPGSHQAVLANCLAQQENREEFVTEQMEYLLKDKPWLHTGIHRQLQRISDGQMLFFLHSFVHAGAPNVTGTDAARLHVEVAPEHSLDTDPQCDRSLALLPARVSRLMLDQNPDTILPYDQYGRLLDLGDHHCDSHSRCVFVCVRVCFAISV